MWRSARGQQDKNPLRGSPMAWRNEMWRQLKAREKDCVDAPERLERETVNLPAGLCSINPRYQRLKARRHDFTTPNSIWREPVTGRRPTVLSNQFREVPRASSLAVTPYPDNGKSPKIQLFWAGPYIYDHSDQWRIDSARFLASVDADRPLPAGDWQIRTQWSLRLWLRPGHGAEFRQLVPGALRADGQLSLRRSIHCI